MKYGIQCWKWRVSSTDEVVFCFGFNGLRSGFMAATTSLVLFSFWGIFLRPNFRFASSFTTSASALRSILSFFFSLSAVSARLFFLVSLESFFLFYCFSFGRTDRRARINIFWVSSVCFLFAPVPRGVSLIRFLQQFSSTIVVSCFTIGRNKSLINGTNVSKKTAMFSFLQSCRWRKRTFVLSGFVMSP